MKHRVVLHPDEGWSEDETDRVGDRLAVFGTATRVENGRRIAFDVEHDIADEDAATLALHGAALRAANWGASVTVSPLRGVE